MPFVAVPVFKLLELFDQLWPTGHAAESGRKKPGDQHRTADISVGHKRLTNGQVSDQRIG